MRGLGRRIVFIRKSWHDSAECLDDFEKISAKSLRPCDTSGANPND